MVAGIVVDVVRIGSTGGEEGIDRTFAFVVAFRGAVGVVGVPLVADEDDFDVVAVAAAEVAVEIVVAVAEDSCLLGR